MFFNELCVYWDFTKREWKNGTEAGFEEIKIGIMQNSWNYAKQLKDINPRIQRLQNT